MSQQNVEIVQQGFLTEVETGEPAWAIIADEVEIHDHDLMDAPHYRGLAGYRSWRENWSSTFPEFSVEPVEWIDAGERVAVVLLMRATGAGSGVTVEREDAMVLALRDGKITRIDYYNNRRQALESVGMDE